VAEIDEPKRHWECEPLVDPAPGADIPNTVPEEWQPAEQPEEQPA
jgi:hypothetical protein